MRLSNIALTISAQYGGLFKPSSLFTTGVNGAWYDPSDFSTMFQDGAGTVPVTAVGQPVGRILDKSGRGNHAYNPSGNSANCPVLQQDGTGRYYLSFNGVNQWLQTNSIDFTYGDKMFVSAGVRKLSDAATATIVELSNSATSGANPGSFVLRAPDGAGAATYGGWSCGSIQVQAVTSATYPSPDTKVLTLITNIGGKTVAVMGNSTQIATTNFNQGTGNYGNHPLYIGARAGTSMFFNGPLYGLVVAGKAASASEIASTEAWLNQKTGAY